MTSDFRANSESIQNLSVRTTKSEFFQSETPNCPNDGSADNHKLLWRYWPNAVYRSFEDL